MEAETFNVRSASAGATGALSRQRSSAQRVRSASAGATGECTRNGPRQARPVRERGGDGAPNCEFGRGVWSGPRARGGRRCLSPAPPPMKRAVRSAGAGDPELLADPELHVVGLVAMRGAEPTKPIELARVADQLTFLYVEHARVDRDVNAVTVQQVSGIAHVPVATLAALLLGPGTRITHAAITLLAGSGCSVLWAGEQGVRLYAGAARRRQGRRVGADGDRRP
jgi:hypothetical protein